jgi:hypothetical protein
MPLGNGDIGASAWVEQGGDLLLLVSKTDAWDDNGRLVKVGRVRVHLGGEPLGGRAPFRQVLDTQSACMGIEAGQGPNRANLRVWVDASQPVVWIEGELAAPAEVQASVELWRLERRTLSEIEDPCPIGLLSADEHSVVEPDQFVGDPQRVVWCHRNVRSVWENTLGHQGLGEMAGRLADPLLGRTFGASLGGEGFAPRGLDVLRSREPMRRFVLAVDVLAVQAAGVADWQAHLAATGRSRTPAERAWGGHAAWWERFWQRSWIEVDGDEQARTVTQGYRLQRYMNACAGRGAQPIKFNGSIFTVDGTLAQLGGHGPASFDPDYRMWGGAYWFQNTRLIYWPMLACGDLDLMEPLFGMYRQCLELARERTRRYFGHDGAFFPETMTFWGTYINGNYGYDRTGRDVGEVENPYIRRYWQGGLELLAMMLARYAHTGDDAFARDTLLPLARAVVEFLREHFPRRDGDGKILFEPAQALETWHQAVNPLPEIAGLMYVLDRLLALPAGLTGEADRRAWARLRADLPPLPSRTHHGRQRTELIPALSYDDCRNTENVALYAVFPYRLLGVGEGDGKLAIGRYTYEQRPHKGTGGWQQSAIQAAELGLADEAARMVADSFSHPNPGCRFPAMWGPNFDWTPDQDHGSVAMLALQRMLLQGDSRGRLHILPAWPARWDVRFRLHAPGPAVVEGELAGGSLRSLRIEPALPEGRVVVHPAQ